MAATITTSILTAGSHSHATTSYEANAFATDFVGQGVVGAIASTLGVAPNTGSFAVNAQASPAMFVDVTAGSAWITGTPAGQASQSLRAYMASNSTSYAISANASGSTKYDWIYLKLDGTVAANPDSAGDDVTSLYTSRSSSNTADNGSPPTYGIPLAIVTVANGASSIGNASIRDNRTQVIPSAQVSGTGTGWTTSTVAPNTVTANGNRSYSLVFNSTDLTGSVSPGMRVQLTRTVAAPTQCTSLNGTTQYYNKTSPAGMTFTDDFVVSVWVKLSSYAAGGAQIASRYNGTSGWTLQVGTSGQVALIGNNAGVGNLSYVQSYQSLPLNKWVHVAAQLDMSAFTATTTTSYVMFDGVDVPATVARFGTNPTALIQAGNLEVGSWNGGLLPFPGKIAQVAIYSAKVTQATILASMNQTLAGTETSLISAYSFNNSINDLNANANNLTAQGSAVATNADSPFSVNSFGTATGTTDYGIVTKSTFSSNTTLVVQVPEANTIPTSGGVSAVSYATVKVPYGFPGQAGKWVIETINKILNQQSSPTGSVWYNTGNMQLNIPIGEWRAVLNIGVYCNRGSGAAQVLSTLSTANNSETNARFTASSQVSAATDVNFQVHTFGNISLAASATHYANISTQQASVTSIYISGDRSNCLISVECALL